MNLILLHKEDLIMKENEAFAILKGREHTHCQQVLKLKVICLLLHLCVFSFRLEMAFYLPACHLSLFLAMFLFIILAAFTSYGVVEGKIKLCEGTQRLSCVRLWLLC